jgi:hypothetical protein
MDPGETKPSFRKIGNYSPGIGRLTRASIVESLTLEKGVKKENQFAELLVLWSQR